MTRRWSSVVAAEVQQFDRIMGDWWNPRGPGKALHTMNPFRTLFVRRAACAALGVPLNDPYPLRGCSVLDLGCGGGLLSESLARLGASVTGVDASAVAVDVASRHARESALDITYLQGSAETLLADAQRRPFDLVVCSEVIEHVADAAELVGHLASLSDGGRVGCVVSTINRTAPSYAAAIVLGEYVMGLVPPQTHDWAKFVTPDELKLYFGEHGMALQRLQGLVHNPFVAPYWALSNTLKDVNYIASFVRPRD